MVVLEVTFVEAEDGNGCSGVVFQLAHGCLVISKIITIDHHQPSLTTTTILFLIKHQICGLTFIFNGFASKKTLYLEIIKTPDHTYDLIILLFVFFHDLQI